MGNRTALADLSAVRATAEAMNCTCKGACSVEDALQCLYQKTLDVLSRPDSGEASCIDLLRPLGVVLQYQKARAGQRDCMAFAETLAAGDPAGALAACYRMMDRTGVDGTGAVPGSSAQL